MSDKMAFLLFGDQSLDVYAFLADFCGGPKIPSVLARSFLEQVGTALKKEVDQLSCIERQRVPRFASVKELNENYNNHEVKNSAVDSALLCITQLAHYIK
jgi:Starter unit:ACP transacylase in aflatoxin biosynthesis